MPDEPDENASAEPEASKISGSSPAGAPSRRKAMTPEMRRFMGPGRTLHDRDAQEAESAETTEPRPAEPSSGSSARKEQAPRIIPPQREMPPPREVQESTATDFGGGEAPPTAQSAVLPNQKLSRALEMQTVALIIGAFVVLGATFYVGSKASYWKRLIVARNKAKVSGLDFKKFPGLSADELVDQALAAERIGNWREAVERFVAAKQRNLPYRGLLYRAAKLCYDHGDFDNADRLFEHAVTFDDHADMANYLRGLIAVGRNDLSAAEHFFEAATVADPFTPGYYFYWGEALRRDHRPNEAVRRYDQAAVRTANQQDAALCRFKARMAKAEADSSPLREELEQKRAAGPLSVDWLLTEAALQIRAGEISEAARLIGEARDGDQGRLFSFFASCVSDMLFTEASGNHPEIAEACRVENSPAPTAAPLATP